jgi:hypothetical protein
VFIEEGKVDRDFGLVSLKFESCFGRLHAVCLHERGSLSGSGAFTSMLMYRISRGTPRHMI